nr:hypothetical protein [uncultured Rhodopila sp.]
MKFLRLGLPLVAASVASGCATVPPSGPLFVVTPGSGHDQAVFQQDSEICQQHAAAGTGYGTPPTPAASAAPANPQAWIASEDQSFLQCMAARGDVVAAAPAAYAAGYPGYTYGFAYPYGYFDAYPVFAGGLFFGGFGYGGRHYGHWHYHGGWGHGGWGHAGWGHGGWGHGGYGHAGGHGGGHH